ncbi:MAG: hypothetical protein ACOYON_00995 [Fimbriimonas sp.]
MRIWPAALLVALLAGASCGGKERLPFLGKWALRFEVTGAGEGAKPADLTRNELVGYLQIYATKNGFILFLEGEQQSIEVRGDWKIERKRLVLAPKDVLIDDRGGVDVRDPNKKYLEPDGIREAYSRGLVLVPSQDGTKLEGLTMAIGPLRGRHLAAREKG